jgi:hypothetical protein
MLQIKYSRFLLSILKTQKDITYFKKIFWHFYFYKIYVYYGFLFFSSGSICHNETYNTVFRLDLAQIVTEISF